MSEALLAAIDRVDVARYVNTLITGYIVLIVIRIIMTWIPRMPYNPVLNAVLTFVRDVTDPYLNLFRRVLPPVRLGPAALDLSPMIGIFVLILAQALIIGLIAGPRGA